jgi:hypothetical protein
MVSIGQKHRNNGINTEPGSAFGQRFGEGFTWYSGFLFSLSFIWSFMKGS